VIPGTISEASQKVLQARYLDDEAKDADSLFRRVSGGNQEYYEAMKNLYFLPNSPTLFNAGTKNGGTLSACFVFDIADSLNGDWPPGGKSDTDPNSIIGTLFKASCVAKAGGGVGYYFGNIRPRGELVKSVHRKACGPVEVIYFMHRLRSLITQGGKRDLAQMGVMPCWHKDFRAFIHAKDADPKALESFNLSGSWTNDYLQKVDWAHFERTDGPIDDETGLMYEHAHSAWRTGCPGILFYDTINKFHPTPHLGAINATNPCGETPNINNEPCNLGSAAVVRFMRKVDGKWSIEWSALQQYVRLFIRFLDDILDWNVFPHPDITTAAMATRKLGLGMMGFADMLALLHIPYDTQDAVDLGMSLMKTINEEAALESLDLAKKKGVYPAWETYEKIMGVPNPWPKARNSTRTSIAPTGTIAIVADVWGSGEPYFALECTRTTHEGIKLTDGVPEWVKKELDGFRSHTPKTAKDISWEWHVKHQAAFQKHTDLGVSKTVNMPENSTVQDIAKVYRMMWETGCKGGTIFRDGCRPEAVLVDKKSVYTVGGLPGRTKVPDELPAIKKKFKIGGTKGYLHVSLLDGKPIEIFIRMTNQGSTSDGAMNAFCMGFSNSLQYGMPLPDLIRLYKNQRFEPNGLTGDKDVPTCTSIPDFVVKWLEKRFCNAGGAGTLPAQEKPGPGQESGTPGRSTTTLPTGAVATGDVCPKCSSPTIFEANCFRCLNPSCGWTKCG
jgi:ribonucleoside-diphosphate reductase alpha chain